MEDGCKNGWRFTRAAYFFALLPSLQQLWFCFFACVGFGELYDVADSPVFLFFFCFFSGGKKRDGFCG